MPYVLRTTTQPTLAQITAVPQIVIIDETGPAIFIGNSDTSVLLVGEFLSGPFEPTVGSSERRILDLFGGVSPFFSQNAAGRQNGGGIDSTGKVVGTFNGNGMLQLKGKTFRKLVIQRVDTEMVTTDGGAVKGTVALTVTVAAADQNGGGTATNKTLIIPAGTRLADQAVGTATVLVSVSDNVVIPTGTAVSANTLTVNVKVFSVLQPEAIAAVASSTIDTVVDSTVNGGAATTTTTAVVQGTALWPPGTGTTLHRRIESQYLAAIKKTLPNQDPLLDVAVIWSARRSNSLSVSVFAIQQGLDDNAKKSSEGNAQGRVAVCSPDPAAGVTPTDANNALTAAKTYASDAGVQDDRMILAWPHTQLFTDELQATVTINPEGWMASVLSVLPNEYNPGASTKPFGGLMDRIVALEPCFVANPLEKQDSIDLKAAGICEIKKDRTAGWWFVDGVTAVDKTLFPGRVTIKRRRMADEIEASLVAIAVPDSKAPATTDRVDSWESEVRIYLRGLLSPDDLVKQRIVDFAVTPQFTKELTEAGIFELKVEVTILPSMDAIVYRAIIGETVTITQQAA